MSLYDTVIQGFMEAEWPVNADIYRIVKDYGLPGSEVRNVKLLLQERIDQEDGPLSGMELLHDCYEYTIFMGVLTNIIEAEYHVKRL